MMKEQTIYTYINEKKEEALPLLICLKMTDEDVSSIIVPSNYAGACESTREKQDHLFALSKGSRCISGSSLFTLKYGVLPCTLSEDGPSDFADSSSDDETGSASGRSRWICDRLKQRPLYHMTRLVK